MIYHHWTDPTEDVVKFKTPYLNSAVLYDPRSRLLCDLGNAYFLLNKWSLAQDRTADNRYTKNMRLLAGSGMVARSSVSLLASIDWYMSLEPEWFSTIYGFIYVVAWSLSALAFVTAVMARLSHEEPMKRIVAPLHFHDLELLLASSCSGLTSRFRSI